MFALHIEIAQDLIEKLISGLLLAFIVPCFAMAQSSIEDDDIERYIFDISRQYETVDPNLGHDAVTALKSLTRDYNLQNVLADLETRQRTEQELINDYDLKIARAVEQAIKDSKITEYQRILGAISQGLQYYNKLEQSAGQKESKLNDALNESRSPANESEKLSDRWKTLAELTQLSDKLDSYSQSDWEDATSGKLPEAVLKFSVFSKLLHETTPSYLTISTEYQQSNREAAFDVIGKVKDVFKKNYWALIEPTPITTGSIEELHIYYKLNQDWKRYSKKSLNFFIQANEIKGLTPIYLDDKPNGCRFKPCFNIRPH